MKSKLTVYLFFSLFLGFSLLSCSGGTRESKATAAIVSDSSDFSFPVTLHYATGLELFNYPDYKEVFIFAPDSRDTLARYILYPKGNSTPKVAERPHVSTQFVPIPIERIACLSTTHIGALPLLGMEDKLVACSNILNIYNPYQRKRVEQGLIHQIGKGMSKNDEQIAAVGAEALLQGYQQSSEKDEDLIAAGTHVLLYNEWKENNPLGRAEWMKLTGILLGANRKADEAFQKIEKDYLAVKELVSSVSDTVQIMYGQDYKGVWYLPGELSYVTALFNDAKVKFDVTPGKVSGAPYSFERIFTKHRHAKMWICMMVGKIKTLDEFLALNERYRHFDAAQTGLVYVDRKRCNEYGGNDFWESGLCRPDLLLKDIIKICHPELLPDYETTYWYKLD